MSDNLEQDQGAPRRNRGGRPKAPTAGRVIERYEAFASAPEEELRLAASVLGVDATPRAVTVAIYDGAARTEPLERIAALLEKHEESVAVVSMMVMGYEREERKSVWRALVSLGWITGNPTGNDLQTSMSIYEALSQHVHERDRVERAIELLRVK